MTTATITKKDGNPIVIHYHICNMSVQDLCDYLISQGLIKSVDEIDQITISEA